MATNLGVEHLLFSDPNPSLILTVEGFSILSSRSLSDKAGATLVGG